MERLKLTNHKQTNAKHINTTDMSSLTGHLTPDRI